MTCRACTLAEEKPLTGFYMSGCPYCKARHLAHSPSFYDSMLEGKKTPAYEQALADAFGEDQHVQDYFHHKVKDWRKRIKKATNDD